MGSIDGRLNQEKWIFDMKSGHSGRKSGHSGRKSGYWGYKSGH